MKLSIRYGIYAVIALIVLMFFGGTFSVISPSQRAVKVTMGTVEPKVYQPGLQWKMPLFSSFRKYDLAPTTDDMQIDIGQGGAISSDNQIIGASAKVIWTFDSSRIMEIVTKFPDTSQLSKIVNNTVYEALKAEIGKYTIFDLAKNAQKIANDTRGIAATKLAPYPILLTQFNLNNWDWSPDFDKRINDTIAAQQKVAQAKADADRVEQEQRAQTITAEATARSLVATATGEKQAAELRAAAKKAEGEGINEYNRLIAQNRELELDFRRLDIQRIRAERWNGQEISTYLPLTAAGGIVTLPSNK